MSNEHLGNALMELGKGLGAFAGVRIQKEENEIEAMRQESLERLRGQRELDIEKLRTENDRTLAQERREFEEGQFKAERTARSEEIEDTQAFQMEQSELDRSATAEQNRLERGFQDRRITAQNIENVSAEGQARLSEIDARIGETQDMLRKAELESVTGVDPAQKQAIQEEIAGLEMQRKQTHYGHLVQLRQLGDPRYKGVDETRLLTDAGFDDKQAAAIVANMEERAALRAQQGAPPPAPGAGQPPPGGQPGAGQPPPVNAAPAAPPPGPQAATTPKDLMDPANFQSMMSPNWDMVQQMLGMGAFGTVPGGTGLPPRRPNAPQPRNLMGV